MTKHYTLIKDELTALIEAFPENPRITPGQKQLYLNIKGAKKILTHEQFAKAVPENSSRKPLCLLEDDGFHSETVGSLGHKSARAFWYHTNDGHVFVPLYDMIKICFFFHCDLFETLRLVLKNEWETYLARSRGYKMNMGTPYADFVPGDLPVDSDFADFDPSLGLIEYQLNMFHRRMSAFFPKPDLSEDDLKGEDMRYQLQYIDDMEIVVTIGREMVLKQLMSEDRTGSRMARFRGDKIREIIELKKTEHISRQKFIKLKAEWLKLQEDHVQLIHDIEMLNMTHARIKKEYLHLFGKEYITFQELIFDIVSLKRKTMHKEQQQALTKAEIDSLVKSHETENKKMLDDLKYWHSVPKYRPAGNVKLPRKADLAKLNDLIIREHQEYELKIKTMIRDLSKLLHPDLMQHNPGAEKLTPAHREALAKLWDDLMGVRAIDTVFVSGSNDDRKAILSKLKRIWIEAKSVLEESGHPGSAYYAIQGKKISDKNAWLKEHIDLFQAKVNEAHDTLYDISQDPSIKEMQAVLQARHAHESYKEDLRNEIARAEKEKQALSAEWDKLW